MVYKFIQQLSRPASKAIRKHSNISARNISNMDLRDMRKSYRTEADAMHEDKLPTRDPFELFKIWFQSANESGKLYEANAVCMTTSTRNGIPSSRMVLLKGFSAEEGFSFYTNKNSRKGSELSANPNACMLFYWDPLNQQVRIEGQVVELERKLADEYFQRRPKGSQLSASISQQSQMIGSRADLIALHAEAEEKYAALDKIPTPESWTGYALVPTRFEFWQGQTNRLHDRIIFTRSNESISKSEWTIGRLQP